MLEDFVERDAELAALDSYLAAARAGNGGLVLVEGPAGIGKTRLLAAARQRAASLGFRTLGARGGELEAGFPYGLVRQLFSRALSESGPGALLAGPAAPSAAVFNDDVGMAMPDTSYAVLRGLFWLAWNLAERSPLFIAADDIHWADPASARFLEFLARRLEGMPVVVIAAARTDEPAPATTVADELAKAADTRILRLAPLSEPAVVRIVREALPDAHAETPAKVFDATRGNPFLLRELLLDLADRAEGAAPGWIVERSVPQRVERHVLARLRKLGDEAMLVARAAAVLGEQADPSTVTSLVGRDETLVARTIDDLSRIQILEPTMPLRFVHPLVRSIVYEDIAVHDRAAMHLDAARAISSANGSAEAAAMHLLPVPPAADPWVCDTLRSAGRLAAGRGAPESAARYLTRALAEAPAPEELSMLLLELGSAESKAGMPLALEHLGKAFESATQPGVLAVASIELGITLMYSERYEESRTVLERALTRLDKEERDLAATIEGTLLTVSQSSWGVRRVLLPRLRAVGDAIAEGLDAPSYVVATVAMDHALARRDSTAANTMALAERAWADGRTLQAFGTAFPACAFAAIGMAVAGRPSIAERWLDECVDHAVHTGSGWGFANSITSRAAAHWFQGNIEAAEVDARGFFDLDPEIQMPVVLPIAAAILADALREQGRLGESWGVLTSDAARAVNPTMGTSAFLPHARGGLLLAMGRPEAALEELKDCAARTAEFDMDNGTWFDWRARAALAHRALGDRETASVLASEQLELARNYGTHRAVGMALATCALIEDSLDLLEQAIAELAASEDRLEHARALVEYGSAIRRSGHPQAARAPLQEGLTLARRCGATLLAERAHAELLAAGGRPRRLETTGAEALTPSELRIARLAAEGKTNRDISQVLFVAPKTVESHMRNIFRKLEIASRTQLAARLKGPERTRDIERVVSLGP